MLVTVDSANSPSEGEMEMTKICNFQSTIPHVASESAVMLDGDFCKASHSDR